jgi:hypothetical protein
MTDLKSDTCAIADNTGTIGLRYTAQVFFLYTHDMLLRWNMDKFSAFWNDAQHLHDL